MHHPGHGDDGCPKCRINIRLMAPLALMLAEESIPAEGLAIAANAAVGIFDALGLGVHADLSELLRKSEPHEKTEPHRCEHAAKLMAWIREPESADAAVMDGWRDEILDDIEELICGGTDAHHGEGG